MAVTLLSALIVCFASLFLGQAALRLAGAREWSWLAPAVGISIGMAVAAPTPRVPGHSLTVAILLAILTVAAAAWCLSSPAHRPAVPDLLAAAPVAALLMVPFLAAGRDGVLGVSIDNDMLSHLLFAEAILSPAVQATHPLPGDYPIGPHAMVALLTKWLGIESQQAFTGWTIAMPILGAWTALAVAQRVRWPAKAVIATVVGLPFLIAAYYGQGSFKEVCQASLVLATALLLAGYGPRLKRSPWIPLALLLAGIVSVYSITGLPWPIAFLGVWLALLAALELRRNGTGRLRSIVHEQWRSVAVATGLLVVLLLPQVDRIYDFTFGRSGITGISESEIGNLAGALPGWEAFGVWGNQDYRLHDTWAFGGIPWTGVIVALVLIGAVWAIRRGRWMIPLAALGAMLIWAVSSISQSPYVSAKGLVIASPLLALLAVLPLTERGKRGSAMRWAAPVIAVLLVSAIVVSDLRALRFSPVGPLDHVKELESFRDEVSGKRVLFLGHDDFAGWALAPAQMASAVIGDAPGLALRPEKAWQPGQALDLDSVNALVLNMFEYVITNRDAAGSAPPPQLHLVAHTRGYDLWRRVGQIPERSVLAEGDLPGATLNCAEPTGLALWTLKGVAAVRPEPVVITGTTVGVGNSGQIPLPLPPGRWQIDAAYTSAQPIQVRGPGLETELPANFDRLGQRWPLGEVEVEPGEKPALTLHIDDTLLAPASAGAEITQVVATPPGGDRVVPLHQACGAYVDWYRLVMPLEPVAAG